VISPLLPAFFQASLMSESFDSGFAESCLRMNSDRLGLPALRPAMKCPFENRPLKKFFSSTFELASLREAISQAENSSETIANELPRKFILIA
jgi:hypothetical protein